MAQGVVFRCTHCVHSIESWDEGNPYYRDERGHKRYAYHPSDEWERCTGNDSPHLCLACAHKFMVDSHKPRTLCPKCKSSDIIATWELQDKPCPLCKEGQFKQDPDFCAIS